MTPYDDMLRIPIGFYDIMPVVDDIARYNGNGINLDIMEPIITEFIARHVPNKDEKTLKGAMELLLTVGVIIGMARGNKNDTV
jgi:hypothetical protein